MIFTLFVIWSLISLGCCVHAWLKGEDIKADPKQFSMFLGIAIAEGLMLGTTIIPPSAGFFAGCLFGWWTFRNAMGAKAILEARLFTTKYMGWAILVDAIFLGLVTISYFGG